MAKRYYWYTQAQILGHLKEEYEGNLWFFDNKRSLFRERIKDYTNVTSNKNKIYVRLIYSVMQALLSLHYSDEMTASFVGRQVGADEIADNLQALADFDFEEMDLDRLSYKLERDRLFYGKSFLVYEKWNKVKKHPVFRPMSPLSVVMDMYPDPILWPRFYHFELEVSTDYLSQWEFYNIDKVKTAINNEIEDNKQTYAENRSLNYQHPWQQKSKNYLVPVNYCFTHLDGDKYFVVTAMNNDVVIKMEKIERVLEEEIKEKANIKFPIIEFEYSPMEWDPFGVCVPDILADKQRWQQLLLNLEKIKSVYAAMGGKYLFDPNKVDLDDLLKVSDQWPTYIPTKSDSVVTDLWSVIVELPTTRVDGDVQAMAQQIQQQAQLDIWLDERSLWISWQSNITATENQRIQKNANLKQVLQSKIKMRWWKRFWWLRYRAYYENFKFSDEKNIILNKKFWSVPMTVKKKDIITWYDIDIKIISKSEREAEQQEMSLQFDAVLPMILQDPSIPSISKNVARRKSLRLKHIEKEETYMLVPPTIEEIKAQDDITLINMGEMPSLPEPYEDIMTYIIVYQQAIPNKVKRQALEALKQYYLMTNQQNRQSQVVEGGMWTSNQLINANIQRQWQGASSLADVSA